MTKNININLQRLDYLMKQFSLSNNELLDLVNQNRKAKKPLSSDDIFVNEIKISNLKHIDKIFKKGLSFYTDSSPIAIKDSSSIFFRKNKFNDDLSLRDKQVVTEFEELINKIKVYNTLSDFPVERVFKKYNTSNNPKTVGKEIFDKLNIRYSKNQKKYLEKIINALSEFNLYVFEFIEHPNLNEKATINGFFIKPDFIVLQRQGSQSYRREIFTLGHELGHYLLNQEEIEKVDLNNTKELSKIENWCNTFSFYFLVREQLSLFNQIQKNWDFDELQKTVIEISDKTHLSQAAIYTRLLYENKIHHGVYGNLMKEYRKQQEILSKRRDLEYQINQPTQIRPPKPIKSQLLIETYLNAFNEGVIGEFQVKNGLGIKDDKFEKLLSE